MEQKLTIEELLRSMLTLAPEGGVSDSKRMLENSAETWRRIGDRDPFSELNFETQKEKDDFLNEWAQNNPYNNL
jgi:hypothetical protein